MLSEITVELDLFISQMVKIVYLLSNDFRNEEMFIKLICNVVNGLLPSSAGQAGVWHKDGP